MGWSARADACRTYDTWTEKCLAQTGSQNVYVGRDGKRYFYETGRERADGAITGSVFRMAADDLAYPAGHFKIDPDGGVVRYPTQFPK